MLHPAVRNTHVAFRVAWALYLEMCVYMHMFAYNTCMYAHVCAYIYVVLGRIPALLPYLT